jgi:hypothetical protein
MVAHAARSIVAWGLAIAVTLLVARDTAFGPTVATISNHHGIHLGDVVIGMVCAAAAIWATAPPSARR